MDELNKQKPEVPVIIIERDEQPQSNGVVANAAPSRMKKWLKRFLALLAIGCMMAAILWGYHLWNYY